MSLSSAMFAGVSGLDATSTAIAVIGNNIANQNTPGFKQSRINFSDVLGRTISSASGFSQIGAGTTVQQVTPLFTQGTFETTVQVTDLAIEGRGFFVLDGGLGRQYTRVGTFDFDDDGFLTAPTGQRVQGFGIDPLTGGSNGQIGDVRVNTDLSSPVASSRASLNLNLNASDPVAAAPFDPANAAATSSFQTVVTLFDSLGNPQPTTFFFTKIADGQWQFNAALSPATPTDPFDVQGTGQLSFDTAGNLTAATGTSITFDFGPGVTPAQTVDFDFGTPGTFANTSTQFANAPSAVSALTQDGASAGSLISIDIDGAGAITAVFSNGAVEQVSQLALAQFPALGALQPVGNNAFIETRDSGQPIVGNPQAGQLGSVRSNSIEQSNVDLAGEFVRLIINQRAFQANTRTISTSNELLANLLSIGQ